ncbi:MAG TPA: hypothetical protein VN963_10870 [bacterium]|nr:hypothetical protein [bacterium]
MGGDDFPISYYDMDKIKEEFLKYAPAYARKEAAEAIEKVVDLQKQGVLHVGLYYFVLIDLVGSTKFSTEHGNQKTTERIKYFVRSSFEALNEIRIKNVSMFIKEIGDAVLFVFQHFPDFIRWRQAFAESLSFLNPISPEPFVFRTCVHIGELDLEGVNPLSLAVSQTFKMEKNVQGGKIVLTEQAYNVAWPTIARAHHGFEKIGSIDLDGFKEKVNLYELLVHDDHDLLRILNEKLE